MKDNIQITSKQLEAREGVITEFDCELLTGYANFCDKPFKRELIVSSDTTNKDILKELIVGDRVMIQVITVKNRRHAKIINKIQLVELIW